MRWLLCCVLLLGCQSSRLDEPGVLVVSVEQQASWLRNFNPLLVSGLARWVSHAAMYEPLFIFSPLTQEYIPWLSTGYGWDETGTVLTVEMRDDVRWSDGEPLGAADVVFTFEYLRDTPAFDGRGIWKFIQEVRVVESGDVAFIFRRPFVPGFHEIAQQVIVPKHIWADIDGPVNFSNPDPVASGPYTEVIRFDSQVFEIGKNPHYWQDIEKAPEKLRFPALISNDQANLALVRGEVDWGGNFVPAIDRIFVDKNPEHHGYWFPAVGGTTFMYANTLDPRLSNPAIRKGLSMAVDRDLLIQVAMFDYTTAPHPTGLSDGYERWRIPVVQQEENWVDLNLERANQWLDQGGWTVGADGYRRDAKGERVELTLLVVSGWSDWVRACQVIAQNLAKVGVSVRVKSYDFAAWHHRLQNGDFELAIGWSNQGATPYNVYRGLMSPSRVKPLGEAASENWHRFGSPQMGALETAFENAVLLDDQLRITHEMQRLFLKEAPAIPLFPAPSWGEYNSTRVTGFPTPENPYARLSPNEVPETLLVLTHLESR